MSGQHHHNHQLYDLVNTNKLSAALTLLNSYSKNDEEAKEQLLAEPYYGFNALMVLARIIPVPEELIRAMVERGRFFDYINAHHARTKNTAALFATFNDRPAALDLLLTLGANPKACRENVSRRWTTKSNGEALISVLDRFEQRTTLACCLRHYDELRLATPSLEVHSAIAALNQFAKSLHDLHGINGESHNLSRIILSYI
jgi:hypothetical protein